jgi:hypothetical protein
MSKKIIWKAKKHKKDGGVTFEEAISTLPHARKACKQNPSVFPGAVKTATTLQLPGWKLALGKMVAHVHPKAKKYYEDEETYIHNQEALEEGRLEAIDKREANAAAILAGNVWDDAADSAALAAYWARNAGEDFEVVVKTIGAAVEAAKWAAVDVNELIDIYFDTLKNKEEDNECRRNPITQPHTDRHQEYQNTTYCYREHTPFSVTSEEPLNYFSEEDNDE